ncbi:hypothetical protein SEA_KUDEFRE_132 [Gordonia phage Kudefre]|uniref:Uncharacterized protein n=1 Tax=Gordonia phage Kudefre TaxID=2885975 RepID=A0AAE8Y930_9CAUD|nr:hypothetical protein L3Y24_gp111 [Gordonia phage Kudefre]UDL15349.1 hypothetical protein SEA_KUDEFRE_132 [Gordonia phage Kudefre]
MTQASRYVYRVVLRAKKIPGPDRWSLQRQYIWSNGRAYGDWDEFLVYGSEERASADCFDMNAEEACKASVAAATLKESARTTHGS